MILLFSLIIILEKKSEVLYNFYLKKIFFFHLHTSIENLKNGILYK